MNQPQVMIDLETMGIDSHAPIVAIGAVKFDPHGQIGQLGDPNNPEYQHFHQRIELHSLSEAGFTFGGNTIKWWLQQGEEARTALLTDPVDIASALSRFYLWYGEVSVPTWGNGAGFDNVILRNAYERLGGVCPFKFRDDRCYRTIRSLHPDIPYTAPKVAHDAMEDAAAQAVHLQKLFNRINFKG